MIYGLLPPTLPQFLVEMIDSTLIVEPMKIVEEVPLVLKILG